MFLEGCRRWKPKESVGREGNCDSFLPLKVPLTHGRRGDPFMLASSGSQWFYLLIYLVPFHYSNLQRFFSFRHRISSYRQTNRYADFLREKASIHKESLHPRGRFIKSMATLVGVSHPWLRHDARANHSCANIGKYFDMEIAWTVHEEDRLQYSGKRLMTSAPKVQDNIQDRCILESSSGFEYLIFL